MGKKQIKLHLFDCKTFCKLVTHSLEGILQKKNRGLSLPNLHLADEWLRGCGLAPIADRAVRKGSRLPGIDWSYLKKLNQILYHIWAVHEVTVQYCVALPFSKNRHQIQTPNATFYMGWCCGEQLTHTVFVHKVTFVMLVLPKEIIASNNLTDG